MIAFFVSDLHGKFERYKKLFEVIRNRKPDIVLLGGDLLPHFSKPNHGDYKHVISFIDDYLVPEFLKIKHLMAVEYPQIYLILGNDDARIEEKSITEAQKFGIVKYLHMRKEQWNGFHFYGYSYVPPTPFRMKDWERYDVSRYVEPGSLAPTEGFRTVEPDEDIEFVTIEQHLEKLSLNADFPRSIFLFHTPPYQTLLDRAALDGVKVDGVPLDVHVGSIAVKRFIETRQPCITLHGHIHESARLTGAWKQTIGKTFAFNAAHDGPELALIQIPLLDPGKAERFLL